MSIAKEFFNKNERDANRITINVNRMFMLIIVSTVLVCATQTLESLHWTLFAIYGTEMAALICMNIFIKKSNYEGANIKYVEVLMLLLIAVMNTFAYNLLWWGYFYLPVIMTVGYSNRKFSLITGTVSTIAGVASCLLQIPYGLYYGFYNCNYIALVKDVTVNIHASYYGILDAVFKPELLDLNIAYRECLYENIEPFAISIAITFICAAIAQHQRNLIDKDVKSRLESQMAVIKATSQRYFCAYDIDVDNDSFLEVFALPNMTAALGTSGTASKVLGIAWSKLVVEEDKPVMEQFHDLSQWKAYLRDRNIHFCEYRGVTSGWSRASIFAAKRNEQGEVTHVVYTLEQIHEQKKAEYRLANQLNKIQDLNHHLEENQAQLEEMTAEQEAQIEEIQALNTELQEQQSQMESMNTQLEKRISVINHFATAYSALYYIDLNNGKFIELGKAKAEQVENLIGQAGDAQNRLNAFVNFMVVPEMRAEYSEFVKLSNVREQLKDYNIITKAYLGVERGWQEGAFIAGERDEDGYCKWVFWAVRNIDDQKKIELQQQLELEKAKQAAEAANQAKSSFLFNMSHDIRTPMNAIMGFRDLLEKHQDEPEKRRDYLRKIEDSSKILLSIINNVLEMARIEKGTVEIDETAWSAEQFNDTIYSVFCDMMKKKGLNFSRSIEVQNNYVFCDPIKLRQVFINLLSNAYKYTERGSVEMHLREIPSDREGWALYQTTITDTGMGMSEEFLPHLFDEFAREHNTTENKIEGTGLGMPIVKRLVELMDGTIKVTSQKGVGTTFVVTIPHRIAERTNLTEHEGIVLDPQLFQGKRILLAEDNDLNAEIAMEILGEVGFILERAEDGQRCCDMLQQAPAGYYDIILMDIQMPRLNGYEATRAIRKMEDIAKANIPILAMTANAFEEDKREALRAGMNGHLAKPINVKELMKALAHILS